ncbi:MAG: thioredoxin [Coriobacteriales bacterium]|nr:thioredoxin [Coriobacteriales bacterium]
MKRNIVVAIGLLVLGVALVVAGVWQGDAGDTLRKATRVCLECIGIG